MTDRELMQHTLMTMENARVFVNSREKIKHPEGSEQYDEVIEALRARLAQCDAGEICLGCRACPDQREWRGLTGEEVGKLGIDANFGKGSIRFQMLARAIEDKLKEKNSG